MTNSGIQWLRLIAILLAASTVEGCSGGSGDVGRVSGKITLEGQPLPDSTVTFAPVKEGGASSLGKTDADGKYELSYSAGIVGAKIGQHRVMISSFNSGNPDSDPPRPKVPEKVPLKYNIRTELVREVKAGENQIDFDLKVDGPVVADPNTIPEPRRSNDDSCE